MALPQEHRLCRKSHIRLSDLVDESFVLCSADFEPSLHRCYLELLKNAGVYPRIVQEVSHLQSQLGLVAAGVGVTLVPSSVTNFTRPGVQYREANCPQVMLPKVAAWIKGIASPQLLGFLAALRQIGARLHGAPLAVAKAS